MCTRVMNNISQTTVGKIEENFLNPAEDNSINTLTSAR